MSESKQNIQTYTIGEVAGKANLNKETIRYYERCGLVTPDKRSESGYKLYKKDTIDRLRFIKQARCLGFSLKEISELLWFFDTDRLFCDGIVGIVEKKIEDINNKIRIFKTIRKKLVRYCFECATKYDADQCPMKNDLENTELLPVKKIMMTKKSTKLE